MPLANAFRAKLDGQEARYNLSVCYCPGCGLVQVPDVVDRRQLFQSYNYSTSASWPMVDHFRRVADDIRKQYLSNPDSLVCEIGSNDGVFLQNLVGKSRVIGIDPANNVRIAATLNGVPTVSRFFNGRVAAALRQMFGAAKVIFSANCLAHVDNLKGMMEGVRNLLADDGVFIFENHRFADMLRTTCFDQIYHEHLSYFTLRPLELLMARFGLRIIETRAISTHGQSFQIHAARLYSPYPVRSNVERIRQEEDALRLDDPETYRRFVQNVATLRHGLVGLMCDLKAQGYRMAGYGAPAKGSTLLNYCEIGHQLLDYVIDSTPTKQGCYVPGTRIPIRHPDTLKQNPLITCCYSRGIMPTQF